MNDAALVAPTRKRVAVRKYQCDDLPVVTRIFNESALGRISSPVTGPVSEKQMGFMLDYYVKDGCPVYVVERDGTLAALLCINRFSWGTQACRLTGECSVYVQQQIVGRGLGMRLAPVAIALARDYGFETLVAWVLERNRASRRSVEALGASLWGRFPGIARFEEQRLDVLLYGLHLD